MRKVLGTILAVTVMGCSHQPTTSTMDPNAPMRSTSSTADEGVHTSQVIYAQNILDLKAMNNGKATVCKMSGKVPHNGLKSLYACTTSFPIGIAWTQKDGTVAVKTGIYSYNAGEIPSYKKLDDPDAEAQKEIAQIEAKSYDTARDYIAKARQGCLGPVVLDIDQNRAGEDVAMNVQGAYGGGYCAVKTTLKSAKDTLVSSWNFVDNTATSAVKTVDNTKNQVFDAFNSRYHSAEEWTKHCREQASQVVYHVGDWVKPNN